MNFKKAFRSTCITALGLMASVSALAGLSKDYIESMKIPVYGIYTSDRADCSNLIPTCTVSSAPNTIDFMASAQTICQNALVPSGTVRCTAVVIKNQATVKYKSAAVAGVGSYSSTSGGRADSVCNAGGTMIVKPCGLTGTQAVTVPAVIAADMVKAGLTPTTSCTTTASGNEVVTIFMSSNSTCTGNSDIDGTTCSGWNTFTPPTGSNDATKGVRMLAKAGGAFTAIKMIPEGVVGNVGGSCSAVAAPMFAYDSGPSRTSVTQTSTAPTILSVSPIAATSTATATLTVTGVGFDPCGAVVTLKNQTNNSVVQCTSATVSGTCNPNASPSGTTLTCTAPNLNSSSTNVVVQVGVANLRALSNIGKLNTAFEFRAAPTITSVRPTRFRLSVDPSPTTITITGTGFRLASVVGATNGEALTSSVNGSNFEVSFLDNSGTRSHMCRTVTIASDGTTATCSVVWPGSSRYTKVVLTNQPDGQTATGSSESGTELHFIP